MTQPTPDSIVSLGQGRLKEALLREAADEVVAWCYSNPHPWGLEIAAQQLVKCIVRLPEPLGSGRP